ncbi:unnamed protein product [Calypogeia fissa]
MGQLEPERQGIGSKYSGIDGGQAGAGGAFNIHELGEEKKKDSGQQKGQRVQPEFGDTRFSSARGVGTHEERVRAEESTFSDNKRGGAGGAAAAAESLKNSAGSWPTGQTGGSKSAFKASKGGGSRGGRDGSSARQGGKGGSSGKGHGTTNLNSGFKDGTPRNGGAPPGVEREVDASKNTEKPTAFGQDGKSGMPTDEVKARAKRGRSTTMEQGGLRMYFDIGRWSSQDVQWPDPGPALAATKALLLQTTEKLQAFVEFSWPIAKTWFWLITRAVLVLSFLSLECGVRGLSSLFRLGSAALFLLVWCTALNLTILAGIGNFSIAIVSAVAAGFFLGYTFAFGLMGLFGAVVLWMYGSFWTTGAIIVLGGGLFVFDHARKAILITMLYSIWSVKGHGGWVGLIMCTIAAFISSDVVVYFLSNSGSEGNQETGYGEKQSGQGFEQGRSKFGPSHNHSNKTRHTAGSTGPSGSFSQGTSAGFTSAAFSQTAPTSEDTRSSGGASTSATSEGGDPTSADEEVARVLGCSDHYAVLGFARYDNFDMNVLKREYRKLAMLVHPDKNRGNEKAEEAFKRLQNAYEVLLDTIKRKVYDEDLRREEALENFKQHRQWFHQAGRCQSPNCGCQQSDEEADDDIPADSRRIACKKCNDTHLWISTERSKLRARWCQECQDYHQAKDGDGWVEQSGQSFFFGMFQKVDVPRAYACAEGKVYDVTEWVICQGMKCPPNTHKPTFHVSTAGAGKSTTRGPSRTARGGGRANPPDGFTFPDFDENMTEHEFFDWLEAAMASGMFSDVNGVPGYPGTRGAAKAGKSTRKKRKGKKQW